MKNKFILTIFLIFFFGLAIAFAKIVFNHNPKEFKKMLFIVVFPDKPPVITRNNFIDPSDREYLKNLNISDEQIVSRDLETTIIMVMKIKRNVHPLTLVDVCKKYKIDKKYWSLKVKYNGEILDDPETMLISTNQIQSVKMETIGFNQFINIVGVDFGQIQKIRQDQKKGPTIGEITY